MLTNQIAQVRAAIIDIASYPAEGYPKFELKFMCRNITAILDALEAAQSENERLREDKATLASICGKEYLDAD